MTTGHVIGYARVSTTEQDAGLEAQIAELEAAGCSKVYREKVSSVDASRPELASALEWLRDGDTFVVTRPDRLARNVVGLLEIITDLKERGVSVRLLSMAVDTSTATGMLILQVLGSVAEFERAVMLERQRAGIARAKALGRYKGRTPTAQAKSGEVQRLLGEGKSVAEVVSITGLSRASVYRVK